ncbi:MAG: DUF368 domain-containing protein [Clostridia bacterium]|nr:DUF368 domain-containing protein [Clostridia bacterium]
MNTTKKILNWIVAVLKGTLVGLAIVIPGVSGGSMLLTIGVYEDAVSITSKDKARRRAAIKKLIPYALGIVLGVVALSFVVTWLLSNFEFFTILLFSGLILGSLPMLFRHIKGHKVKPGYILVALVMIALMVLLPYLNDNTTESFRILNETDTLSVGERIILQDEQQFELVVQNGDPNYSVWEIKSAGGTFGKPSDGYKLRSGADKKAFMKLSGTEILLTKDKDADVFDLRMNADGTLALVGHGTGETLLTTSVYRAADALNNGFVSALLALLLGFIAAGTMIVPGISGSMVMLVLGYYYSVMTHLKSFVVCVFTLNFAQMGNHLLVLIPFGIGIILGLLIVSKAIRWLLDKHPTPTYYGILALMLASPYAIFLKAKCFGPAFGANLAQWWFIPVAVLSFALGFVTAYFMSKKEG